MKRIITIVAIALVTIFLYRDPATSVNAENEALPPQQVVNSSAPIPDELVYIDNIGFPLRIAMGVQMKYQGFAVTKVEKIIENGKELYRLRVDRDDLQYNGDSFYLIFDNQWKYIEERKVDLRQPVAVPEAQPMPLPEPVVIPKPEANPIGGDEPQIQPSYEEDTTQTDPVPGPAEENPEEPSVPPADNTNPEQSTNP